MATLDSNDPQRRTLTEAVSPEGYRGIFKQGLRNLNQPGELNEAVLRSGTGELAEAFVDRYYERTGKLPSSYEVKTFVAQNLTTGFAQKYIEGTLGDRSVVKAKLVDPFLDYSDVVATPDTVSSAQSDKPDTLSSRLDDIYGGIRENETANIRDAFAPSRKRAIEEEAASGRLRSGVSYGRDSAIAGVDVNEGKALSSLISSLGQSRAAGEFEAAKGDKDLAARLREFTKTLGLDREKFKFMQDQQDVENSYNNKALSLSERIGKMQAEGRKPGTLDYVNTGLTGLSALSGFFRPRA